MYRHVLEALPPAGGSRALEVGSGTGSAARWRSRSTASHTSPAWTSTRNSSYGPGVQFPHPQGPAGPPGLRPGAAEDMPFADGEFDYLYSVEAAQHFSDLDAFGRETARVLRPGGHAVVASFFTTDDAPGRAKRLAGLLDCYANGLDIAHPVTHVVDALARAGLKGTRAVSIGPSVWQGWDRWIAHVSEPDGWPRNFLRVHEEGVLDYYVVTATRPAP
nr:class I SAM-dependent methyltransferase [Streptomyces cinnamoneus]